MEKKRIRQIIWYGWKDAGEISKYPDINKSRISIFLDIWQCFKKYYIFSNQYKKQKVWELSDSERLELADTQGRVNRNKDEWVDVYKEDWRFLNKYTSLKWQKSLKKVIKRRDAYIKHYGLGEDLHIQYGVTFICEHFSVGKITCGKNVMFARNCDIDYTGDIEIGDNACILEGAKILTHAHDNYHFKKDSDLIPFSNRAFKTNLKIGKRALICARAVILPGVTEIGEGAIIQAGAVVDKPVPPNVIVAGVPAQVVRKIPANLRKKKEEA